MTRPPPGVKLTMEAGIYIYIYKYIDINNYLSVLSCPVYTLYITYVYTFVYLLMYVYNTACIMMQVKPVKKQDPNKPGNIYLLFTYIYVPYIYIYIIIFYYLFI